ncbi:PREDICTED: eyes absent homolog 4-like [Priapulus caudatus]|uniref:Eyes absent homolog n=1 Tax=Priapulus caudatus TaxID=37621 RepID=A0ABM1FBT7_PRICU|nr:PREDICTED: eyes absent homolog 4-like [Priapulus caudatus]
MNNQAAAATTRPSWETEAYDDTCCAHADRSIPEGDTTGEEQIAERHNALVLQRWAPGGAGVGTGVARGQRTVFIWDLDETIIIFHSLITGSFARKYDKDVVKATELGKQMEELLFRVLVTYFFYYDLSSTTYQHISDILNAESKDDSLLSYSAPFAWGYNTMHSRSSSSLASPPGGDDERWLAARYRKVETLYVAHQHDTAALLGPNLRKNWRQLQENIESFSERWLDVARTCLSVIGARLNCENVIVTSTRLLPALAKLLLYDFGAFFPIENVYSAAETGKKACFERISLRFGRAANYLVLGNGKEEEAAATQLGIPHWKIACRYNLEMLYRALDANVM